MALRHSHVRVLAHALQHRAPETETVNVATATSLNGAPSVSATTGSHSVFKEPSNTVKALCGVIAILVVFLIGMFASHHSKLC
jgi:hypothetical protein